MRVVLISHCNFDGNSAIHVLNMARELQKLGHECIIGVPDNIEDIHKFGTAPGPVSTYDSLLSDIPWRDPPDLIHAWTPRNHVKTITEALVRAHGCPYLVHMEDNEEKIVSDALSPLTIAQMRRFPDDIISQLIGYGRSHPREYRDFIAGSAGYTCLIDRLLEFKEDYLPSLVFWPGYEPEFEAMERGSLTAKTSLNISQDEIVFFYAGNVHPSILADVRTLYVALAVLRRRGYPVRLIKTGWNFEDIGLGDLSEFVLDLGFVDRARLPYLLSAADILVQPGKSDLFNDYRFPSKLPEYLISGRPVILPDSNIGLVLEDGVEAVKLREGTASELADKIEGLLGDPAAARRIGENGRRFAQQHLSWSLAARRLSEFYSLVTSSGRDGASRRTQAPPVISPAPEAAPPEYPVKLIAIIHPPPVPPPRNENGSRADRPVSQDLVGQIDLAKAHGIAGFCIGVDLSERHWRQPLDVWLSNPDLDFAFLICCRSGAAGGAGGENRPDAAGFARDLIPILQDPRYVRVKGAPMLLIGDIEHPVDEASPAERIREICREGGLSRIHLCALRAPSHEEGPVGFDAVVDLPSLDEGWGVVPPKGRADTGPVLIDYIALAARSMAARLEDFPKYQGILPCGAGLPVHGRCLLNDSPKAYAHWLRSLAAAALGKAKENEPLIFINGWNDGGGGTLAPSQRFGSGLLHVTRLALNAAMLDHFGVPKEPRERAFNEAVSILPGDLRNRA